MLEVSHEALLRIDLYHYRHCSGTVEFSRLESWYRDVLGSYFHSLALVGIGLRTLSVGVDVDLERLSLKPSAQMRILR